jgi:type IV pilus assembly protein PilW
MKQPNPVSGACAARATQRGMTLIELMVAMVISFVLSLAIFGVLASAEGLKRTTTSVNDINQTGNYAMYTIDKWVRSAGSGFAQSAAYAFGCTLHASRSGTQVLPATAAAPAPFDAINTTGTVGAFRMAPILIAPGQTTPSVSGAASDALIVMAGSAGYGESAVDLSDLSAETELKLTNTVSFKANDIVLVANRQGAAGTVSPCMVQQVSAVAGKAVSLGGAYADASIGSESLTAMPLESAAVNLGNVVGNNPPTFLMIGVGADNTLFSYDLLQTTATPLLPIAAGVFEMHALYGVDNDDNGTIDAWVDPSSSATYTLAALMAGDQTAAGLLRSIKAVRVGLITRTSLPEKTSVAPATLTLFSDVGLPHTRTLTAAERVYRYRTIESTIPIRNSMLLN